MATGGLYGSSATGALVASPGSESAGLYGSSVNFSGTFFQWFIFQQASTQPATPTGGSWNFSTQIGTPPSGWSNSPPSAPTNQIWVSIAFVNSLSTSTITWSVPGLLGVIASTNVGITTTGAAGSSASVSNSGTPLNAILNFTIPRGDTGATGATGPQGPTGNAATLALGTVTTGAAGSSVIITNSGTTSAAVFNFTIPRGDTGATGATGATGTAATIAVGTTTTGLPGTSATVTNSGTSSAAIFDFTIPKGAGVLAGGTTGQFLAKASSTDYDTQWLSITGGLSYLGTWNASTNTPTLTSSVGVSGGYYVVSVAGSTNLNGVTDWQIGDWAIFNGSFWQKIDQTNLVTSVNGQTGAVSVGTVTAVGATAPVLSSGGTTPTISLTTSGANSVVVRDASQNISVNSISESFSNVAATGTTTVLTVASSPNYVVTGSGGQTYQLPDATTLNNGVNFTFNNNQSSGSITVNNNSGTLIVSVPSGAFVDVSLLSNSSAAGSWDTHFQSPSNVSWSTNTFSYAGSITNATWNGVAVAINRGGTGQATASAAFNALSPITSTGDLVIGNGTNSATRLGIGTSGYVLTSNGTTATWSASTGGVTSFSAGSTGFTPSTGTTGAVTLAGTLAIASGGTGQTTANTAFNALAPSQSTNSGKYLTTDGTNTSWGTVSAGASLSNDTSTASNLYPIFASATSGTPTTVYTSNAKYLYKPSTGELSVSVPVASNGIVVNSKTVSTSYTIAAGYSAMSAGPISVSGGVTVTLGAGSRWVIQ